LVAVEHQIGACATQPRASCGPEPVLAALHKLATPWARHWLDAELPTNGVCRAPGLGGLLATHLTQHPNAGVVIKHIQILRLSDSVFQHLGSGADLDPMAQQVLGGLQPAIASQWLADPQSMLTRSQPVRKLFELLVRVTRGLDCQAGQRAFSLASEIRQHLFDSVGRVPQDGAALIDSMAQLTELLNHHQREIRLQEQRLIEQERGNIHLGDARQIVAGEIRQRIQGQLLPRSLIQFLNETWSRYLQATYLSEGIASADWKAGLDTISELVWSVTTREPDALRTGYTERVNPMLVSLRHGADSVQSGSQTLESFIEQLDAVHFAIMAGEEPDPAELTRVPAEPQQTQSATIEPPSDPPARHLGETLHLRPGEWFRWHDSEGTRRCRLVENDRSLGHLLFGNLSGIRVVRLGHAEAAEALETGRLQPIDKAPVFDRLLGLALKDWRALLERRVQELARNLRERHQREDQACIETAAQEEQAHREAEAREQERIDVEALAEEGIRQEVQHQALEAAEAGRRARQEAREKAIAQRTHEMRRLQPGAIVELINDHDRPVTCKLALVLRSSRKMVFVDHIGRRVAELQPEQLAARVVEGSAEVRDFGTAFDESLHQLIKARSDAMPTR